MSTVIRIVSSEAGGPIAERERRWFGPGTTRALDCLLLAVAAMAVFLVVGAFSGAITVNDGYGYDGFAYVGMVNEGMGGGNPSTRLRPVVVLLVTAADRLVFHDPLASFRALNVVFTGVLALALASLCRRYGASRAATTTLIVNLALAISTAKMFGFYPTLVDLGAYVFMTVGALAIVAGHRVPIVVACVLAVLSREFAGTLIVFGVIRDLRLRRSLLAVAATYLPVAAAVVGVRWLALSYSVAGEELRPLTTMTLAASLLANLTWWRDPRYVAFWLYFAVTLFGGVSMAILASGRAWSSCLRREPEWLAILLPIAAITAMGYTDMWRYLAFVLPAVPVLWVWAVSRHPPASARWLFAVVTLVTCLTQRPWQAMDVATYFRDWFPYFLIVETPATADATLWPLWTYRLAAAMVALAVTAWLVRAPRRPAGRMEAA